MLILQGQAHRCLRNTPGPERGLDMESVSTRHGDGAGFPLASDPVHNKLGKSCVFLFLQHMVILGNGYKHV